MQLPPIEIIIATVWVLFFAIGLHEYAHCKFADMAGDPTPSYYGRVTLNLFKHFEPVGTMMMVFSSLTGFGIGWGRAAPINPDKMRNPRWDTFIAVAAGPTSNVLQALLYATALRISIAARLVDPNDVLNALRRDHTTIFAAILTLGVIINLSLAAFNLIPLGKLDGHWLVGLLLPPRQRLGWFQFNRSYGDMLLIGVIILSQTSSFPLLSYLLGPPILFGFRLMTGLPI